MSSTLYCEHRNFCIFLLCVFFCHFWGKVSSTTSKKNFTLTFQGFCLLFIDMYLSSNFLYLCSIGALLLSLIAQFLVKSSFSRYSKDLSKRGVTGAQAAAFLLKANGITDVSISQISGSLTDNYNPSTQILSLSESTFSSTSIAAIGVAAHETGHAIQHAQGYPPLKLRSLLVPVANLGSRFGPLVAIAGLLLPQLLGRGTQSLALSDMIINIGLILFSAAMLFYLITLPVEFNASHRALKILKANQVLDSSELWGVRKVLTAAALTYVAAALSAFISFLRIYSMTKNRRR